MDPLITVLDGAALNPGDLSWQQLRSLGQVSVYDKTLPSEVVERCIDSDIIVVNKVLLDKSTINRLPKLKLIAVTATGYNNIDTTAASSQNILVCNVPIYGTDIVAQFTFALILELCHQVGMHNDAVHNGEWIKSKHFAFWKTSQMELVGKQIGIVGYGRIGKRVEQIAKSFGMIVAVHSRTPEALSGVGVNYLSLDELFSTSDFVTLHCPLTIQNAKFVNLALLSQMKHSAFFINTARGGLVDEDGLAIALKEGRISGAALDVISQEPMSVDSPLLNLPNCIITPHMAWGALEARTRMMSITCDNIRHFLEGNPTNIVNG